jgi:hypothetical protein
MDLLTLASLDIDYGGLRMELAIDSKDESRTFNILLAFFIPRTVRT